MSELALKLIAEAKRTRATCLDLGNCGLTELPDELFELTWLEELNLSNWKRKKTEKNYVFTMSEVNNSNEFDTISHKISKLKELKTLIVMGFPLASIPKIFLKNLDFLFELNKLETLYASFNPIDNIDVIKYLHHLRSLHVGNTRISNLNSLKELIHLQDIVFLGTQVNDLNPLKNLKNLKEIRSNSVPIEDLAPLYNLKILKELDISFTKIRDLSPLKDLKKLQELNVASTFVSDLESLQHLKWLKELNISSTLVSNLDPLKDLHQLQSLNIADTQVSDLSPLKYLVNLEQLAAQNTQVNDLKPLKTIIEKGIPVKRDKYSRGIMIIDCPISNPPIEIVEQGNEAILRYWAEQDRIGKKKVNEARLLLVGQGQSGKTTLKDKLKDCNAPMPEHDATTKGINIERLTCQNTEGGYFTVQVWDFGGQNIQKYAHQFFMSDSVVYAVLSNTREQNPNFQYWLNIIELLGKDSPFFIVQNEKDGHAESLKDITQIQERFPHTFKSVEQVNLKNAATDPRFEILKQRLFYAATQLPHTQKEYLVSFINVRAQLEALSKTQQTITFKEFKQLCKAEGIEDTELMNDYARTFTLLGIALHFADDLHLKTQVFLRPKWIIDALFAVLYADIVEKQHGKFSAADAAQIWHEEEYEDMHGVLLQLMVKFHLCYEIPNTKDYIVPQRLQARLKAFMPPPDATHIIYRYRFLPSGILTQLTCRLHQRIEDDNVWNDAVQFSTKNGQGHVFVRENSAENHLELFGFGSQKADLINVVVDTIDEIHLNSKFGNLKVEKLVPCPCPVCANNRSKQEDAEFFDYDFLIELLQEGETESDRCKLSKKKFPIKAILKNASIHVFKIEHIRKLLERDKTEEALNILRGALSDDDEVIIQLSRLSHLKRGDRMGQLSFEEANRERNKVIKGVLEKLREWETDL